MKKTAVHHLEELRKRLIIILLFIVVFSILGIYLSGGLIRFLSDNLAKHISVHFISLTPFEFIKAQIKTGIIIGVAISLPIAIYELIRFIKPALSRKEKRYVYALAPIMLVLFAAGVCFAYFVLLKTAIFFLGTAALNYGIENYWSIDSFLTTVVILCIATGILFNMPALIFLLSKTGILKKEMLSKRRAYVYVLIFIIAAVITPTPDVFTQTLIAVPTIVLYEISLLVIRH